MSPLLALHGGRQNQAGPRRGPRQLAVWGGLAGEGAARAGHSRPARQDLALFEDAAGVGKAPGPAHVPRRGVRERAPRPWVSRPRGRGRHPASPGDFERLLGDLGGTGQLEVVYLYSRWLDGAAQLIAGRPPSRAFHLAQALARSRGRHLC
jgi:hypothetical protein